MIAETKFSSLPPFPERYRSSGVLLHVTSLPSPYGIGDVGPTAVRWIDRLHDSGQHWWQLLPLGPTGYGNSPYQPLSSFAGNELLVSPDWLIEDDLLKASDCDAMWDSASWVDFDKTIAFKRRLLATALKNFRAGSSPSLKAPFEKFCVDHAHWLDDYALFRALKDAHDGAYYLHWPAELVERQPEALAAAKRMLAPEIEEYRFVQFVLFRQAARLKAHAASKGVRIIGDLPFFVSPDSSDVWANPELFLLDQRRHPQFVGGVPPDYFSADGQLWGNPVYDWEAHRQTGYRWFINRLQAVLEFVDSVRLDHFRGFAAAWYVPAGETTAKVGEWTTGPDADLFQAIESDLGALPFFAEDLGTITPDVYELRDKFQLPGSRVLQFAFDGQPDNPYLPENYISNTVVYTGTHDNATSREWFEELPGDARKHVRWHLNAPTLEAQDISWALIRLAWESQAALSIVPLQDILSLGKEARMNVPGRADGNWAWRCTDEMFASPYWERLLDMTQHANRLAD
ncbi:4-alpha-glucanotransferase [Blastopirellula retiformator]|uniref:4-alpha-glucanotransferase n=1 Tax=Blastopirellula retiformator TaxID=2527970 RepID=A0A5C5V9F3_9BACT|nr:4-alpha-glucanotransferase [Blastopirellula retiformator]TWT34563.1 4-alpha-glucanotransferase [Blastopirellula retiformator]